MTICVPVKDMKDTGKFSRLVEESREPIVVTRNGYDVFVVMRSEDYEAFKLIEAKAELFAKLARSQADIAAGAVTPAESLLRELEDTRHA